MERNQFGFPQGTQQKRKKVKKDYGPLTVASLREKGYRIKVYHERRVVPGVMVPLDLGVGEMTFFAAKYAEKGGATHVSLVSAEGAEFKGTAKCSNLDHYCRKEGVRIALQRAFGVFQK